jgi:molecular chaperone GrpE
LQLVYERAATLLATEEIQAIDALHKPFDPRLHVAVGTAERADLEPNRVVQVMRKGYRQRERVLRYAEVIVSRQPAHKETL